MKSYDSIIKKYPLDRRYIIGKLEEKNFLKIIYEGIILNQEEFKFLISRISGGIEKWLN